MNLHQLRFVREAVRQNYNLTDAAKALFTSQPGVSKAIIELEEELGVDIFTRHGKRIRGLTEPGRLVLESVELIMQEIDSMKRIGKEFAAQDSGSFTIATTHTQARYTLPKVVQAFMLKFPKVRLSLLQGNPRQIAEMVQRDQADLAVATESIAALDGPINLSCYQLEEVVVVLARAAAGTMSPATKTPQIALTPRKRTNLPSVVAVSKMGCFFAAIFPVYRQGLRFEV